MPRGHLLARPGSAGSKQWLVPVPYALSTPPSTRVPSQAGWGIPEDVGCPRRGAQAGVQELEWEKPFWQPAQGWGAVCLGESGSEALGGGLGGGPGAAKSVGDGAFQGIGSKRWDGGYRGDGCAVWGGGNVGSPLWMGR